MDAVVYDTNISSTLVRFIMITAVLYRKSMNFSLLYPRVPPFSTHAFLPSLQ